VYKSVVAKKCLTFNECDGISPFSVLVPPHYRNFFRRAFAEHIYPDTRASYKSTLEIFSRGTRGRPIIGSQSHPARPVSAQRDTRRFIRRPSLLFLPHTYRKHFASLTYPTYPRWNRFISDAHRQRSRAPHLTRPEIIVRANVIKRIAPRVYCEETAAASERMMETMEIDSSRCGSAD